MSGTSVLSGSQEALTADPVNRRNARRTKTLMRGTIYYNDRSSAAECLVRDISDTGAKLEISENVVIPYLIDLFIPKREETFRASVQWRHGDLMGVAFINPTQEPDRDIEDPKAKAPPVLNGARADRLQQLEQEVAELKRIVKQLQAANPLSFPV